VTGRLREIKSMTVTRHCPVAPRNTACVGVLILIALASAVAARDPAPRADRLSAPPLDI
jgi:hypothetical protein